jgi:hypothetical protein
MTAAFLAVVQQARRKVMQDGEAAVHQEPTDRV